MIQIEFSWTGELDRQVFADSWAAAADRHEVLRTGFELHGADGLRQTVHTGCRIPIRWLPYASVADVLRADRHEPFDLSTAPLARITVIEAPERTVLFTLHHSILDGRSVYILFDEFFTDYAARLAGHQVTFPERPPFRDFVNWLQAQDTGPAKDFWSSYLDGCQPLPALSGYVLPQAGTPTRPLTIESVFTDTESQTIRRAAEEAGVSVGTLVNAAWGVLRSRHAGREDVIFGVTRSCRQGTAPGSADMVGLLINTVPLRIRIDGNSSVSELLRETRQTMRRVRDHQLAPISAIVQWAGHPADTPIVDSIVVFERQLTHTVLAKDHEFVRGGPMRFHRLTGFPATLYVFDEPEIKSLLIFDESTLPIESAESLHAQFRTILLAMATGPGIHVRELSLTSAHEGEALQAWQTGPDSAIGSATDPAATIPGRFAEQVARTPEAIAVNGDDGMLTYAQLDERTDRLAAILREHGIGCDSAVAVALPRSVELIVALLAIAKAGGAYVAMDPADPPSRSALILESSQATLVLTPELLASWRERLAAPGEPFASPAHPMSAAYISYTSGSTGRPKGVAVPHRAVLRLITQPCFADLGPREVLLQLAPVAFDASTLEIWGALLTGARLAVAPAGPLDLTRLGEIIKRDRVSLLWLTAGLFHQVVELDVHALAGARHLMSGGDVLSPQAVSTLLTALPGLRFSNGYGPTENTTFSTWYSVPAAPNPAARIPIGAPIQGTTAYVLDDAGQPCPVGVTGELYVGGEGLARGYIGSPALTASRFLPNPFAPGQRLYRTFDLARWRADGVLEFLGRADRQVKIRGFRVEPGEVEAVLRAHPAVKEAVVVVRGDDADRYLAGYVTTIAGADLTVQSLHEHASQHLPAYLVPAEYALVEEFPLGPTGKVDRDALPRPARPRRPHSEPATPTQKRLAVLWQDMLDVAPGPEDNFFVLGGNSLALTRLLFRIRETFGVQLNLAVFYERPTLAGVASAIDETPVSADSPVRQDSPSLPSHLVPLTDGWALWRDICLRGAGLPHELLSTLADEHLAAVTDSDFDAEWPAATARLSQAVYDAATHPVIREAVAWQGKHALRTGLDSIVRHGPRPKSRDTKHRQHEALVASYVQRYCAKNDTIGFFGPVGWASFDTEPGVHVTPAPLAKRSVHMEAWAVIALLGKYTTALRPWLVPRLPHHLTFNGTELLAPMAPPIALGDDVAGLLRAVDSKRTAVEIAQLLDRPISTVCDQLARLSDEGRVVWRLETAADDIYPERTLRGVVERAAPGPVRDEALAVLDEYEAGREALAAAGGDADRVVAAMEHLESVFTGHTGLSPVRRHGELYAGRTLIWEECLRGGDVRIGTDLLDGVRDAMGIVLDAADWFTAASAALWHRKFLDIFRARLADAGGETVSLAEFWLLAGDTVYTPPPEIVETVQRGLQLRWARVLQLPETTEPIQLSSVDLRERAAKEFTTASPGWPTGVQHSPDLMLAGDRWVLGELHPGINTMRYHSWVALHPDPQSLRDAHVSDIGKPVVYTGPTGEVSGVPARQGNSFVSPSDLVLTFAFDTCPPYAAATLAVSEADVRLRDGRLVVQVRATGQELPLITVLGDMLAATLVQYFKVVSGTGSRTPRVSIDNLVVSRAAWRFEAGRLPFAKTPSESLRYRQVRAWARDNQLPRHVFLRTQGEAKPIYLDLTSLVSVDLLARAVRRAERNAGPGAKVSVTEMLPGPDQLWLTGPDGRPVTAELRVVATRLAER